MDLLPTIKKNLKEMLEDRKYKYESVNDEENYMIYKNGDKKVIVYFSTYNDKANKEYVRNKIIKTEEMEIKHIILVSEDGLTPSANKYIQTYPLTIEFFLFDELKFNITKHKLVPKHVLLNHKESLEIINYYGKLRLPQIKQKDIVSRYFKAEVGQIFRIYRNEGGMFYRLVIG